MRKYLSGLILAASVVLSASFAGAATNVITEPFEGVRLIHSKSTVPRLVDMWLVEIDMKAPGISFLVTPSNGDLIGDTTPQTVRTFVTQVGAQIGVNGSFFSMAGKGPAGKVQYNVSGLSASKGDAYSPFARGFVDAINISRDNVATIIRGTGDTSKASSHNPRPKGEVSKASSSNHVPGTVPKETKEINIGLAHEPAVPLYNALSGKTRLVKSGKNVAGNDPAIHPRTAVGIKADGKLLLFTVDGREPGHSLGMKFSEMADVLIQWGAKDAISLDGGGSTTLVMDDPATAANDPKVMNLPCDLFPNKEHGKERPVGNCLVVFAKRRAQASKNEADGAPRADAGVVAKDCGVQRCTCSRPTRHCCGAGRRLVGFVCGRR